MDSAPKISDSGGQTSSSTPGEFGRTLALRMSPQVTVIRRAIVQPGFIARRSVAFGSYIGQSQVSRWSIGATMSRGALSVRPPLDYWPWASTEEPAPVAVPRLERSLPRTTLLRRTAQPQPGEIVKLMRPEVVDLATRGQAKQAKEPKRSKMDLLKDMLVRTGELPASDGTSDTEILPSTAVRSGPGRDRFEPAALAQSASPVSARRPDLPTAADEPPTSTTPWTSSAPTSTAPTTQASPAPRGAAVGSQPTGADLPVRRSPVAAGGPTTLARADTATDSERAPQPAWPTSATPAPPSAPTPAISAQRAAEQLRSTRGPRPLPTVTAPRFEQPAERRWGITDTVDAQELAERLTSARAAASDSAQSPPTQPQIATATLVADRSPSQPWSDSGLDADAEQEFSDQPVTDAATATVAPVGMMRDRAVAPHLDDEPSVALRRSLVEQHQPRSTADNTSTTQRASDSDPRELTDSDQFVPGRSPAPTPAPARPPGIHPTPASLRRSTPNGASLLLPSGEPAAAPRTDGRERARQLPIAAARPGGAPATGLSDRSQGVLARPITPQPPSVELRSELAAAPPMEQSSANGGPSLHAASDWSDTGHDDLPTRLPDVASRLSPTTDVPTVRRSPDTSASSVAPPSPPATLSAAHFADSAIERQSSQDHSPTTRSRGSGFVAPPAATIRPTPDRFLEVLRATSAPSPRPLPARFAPLAQAIVGSTDVLVRHDAGSRAALAAVGKRAATIGNTIHLAQAPHGASATTVLAHELTHVANPTLAPRFFDDERQSVEERRADAVAQLIQRSPSLLTAAGASVRPLGRTAHSLEESLPGRSTPAPEPASAPVVGSPSTERAGTIRRSLAAVDLPLPPPRFAPSGLGSFPTTNHDAPGTASLGGTSAGVVAGGLGHAATVRRSVASPALDHSPQPQSAPATTIRRAPESDTVSQSPETTPHMASEALPERIAALSTSGGVVDFVDWIVEQVEDRVVAEFQRRGGRFREDF